MTALLSQPWRCCVVRGIDLDNNKLKIWSVLTSGAIFWLLITNGTFKTYLLASYR